MDIEGICREVIGIARNAGEFIRTERMSFDKKSVESKGIHDYVSYVDKKAEDLIVDRLGNLFPEAGFIAEEGSGEKNREGWNWIIDPLDGTTNFIHGLPPYSVSIALVNNRKAVTGVVYEINLDECFYSWEGAPAYMNGQEIKVSDAQLVKESLIATGFPYTDFSHMKPFLGSFRHFMENSHGLRRLGSAAVDLAYVACGRFDAFYEYGLSPWDVAAGTFIVSQAGGKICDFSGGDDYLFGGELIASNSMVYEEFKADVQRFMKAD
ncbi:MAG: inositol monophosphatase family protein [Bacteroidales bacterium]